MFSLACLILPIIFDHFNIFIGAVDTTGSMYKRLNVDVSLWTSNYKISHANDIKSSMVCGSLCKKSPTCKAYHLRDDMTCELGSWYTSCVEPEGGNIKPYVESGRTRLLEGESVHEYTIANAADKAHLRATSPVDTWQAHWDGDNIIDANFDPNSDPFHAQVGLTMPWIQIELAKEMLVKGVVLHATRQHTEYLEIRIGNTLVDEGVAFETRICKNQLCYMTGQEDIYDKTPLTVECALPLPGKYITLQKYDYMENLDHANKVFELKEVDITVHCGPYIAENDNICESHEGQLDHCAMASLATGKSEHTSTNVDKQTWAVSSSSVHNSFGPENDFDGNYNGDAQVHVGHFPFATAENVEDFPWLQTDFLSRKLVKAVHIYPRNEATGNGIQITQCEVRVGDVNAAASLTEAKQRICVNALCKTTGTHILGSGEPHLDTCSSPLSGRYLTIQQIHLVQHHMMIAEIDVVFLQPFP